MAINFALLGTGRIARDELAPALATAEGARLWSVLSRDLGRAREFAHGHRAAAPQPAFTDLGTLLADPDLDAVLIATPDRLHASQVIAAAGAGKHVLCEKPLATGLDEGRAMVDSCRRAGVRLGVGYHLRWHAGHRALVEAIGGGLVGTPRHVRALWTHVAADDGNWRAHPELGRWWGLAGVGTHCLDLVRWVMAPIHGEVVELVSVIDRSVWHSPHDETAVLAMRFESGGTAELCSSVVARSPGGFEIYGSEGYAICRGTLGGHGGGEIVTHQGTFPFQPRNPYVGEIEDFVAAVVEGREPEVGGEEGLRNVELLLEAVNGA
jgi:1,5-anhydro-D-fructose reductase (1,5-anhydro-D-mannitol-forming)